MKNNIVEYDNVTVNIGNKKILSDASCSIPREALTFLGGENGSGKTTLVKSILGLLPISNGTITFNSTNGSKPVLGYVPQNIMFPTPFNLTVSEYLKYAARVPRNKITRVLERVDFPETHFSRNINELSGGQAQKMLLAAELYRSPELLFLDEPLSNVDDSSEKHIIDVILEVKNEGVSVVIITHDWQFVSSYGNHVICLNRNFICDSGYCVCKNSLSKVNIKNIQKTTPDPNSTHSGYCYIENI